jgi:hypothetical protein
MPTIDFLERFRRWGNKKEVQNVSKLNFRFLGSTTYHITHKVIEELRRIHGSTELQSKWRHRSYSTEQGGTAIRGGAVGGGATGWSYLSGTRRPRRSPGGAAERAAADGDAEGRRWDAGGSDCVGHIFSQMKTAQHARGPSDLAQLIKPKKPHPFPP